MNPGPRGLLPPAREGPEGNPRTPAERSQTPHPAKLDDGPTRAPGSQSPPGMEERRGATQG